MWGVGHLRSSSEPTLKRVARAVGEERRHARCREARGGLGDVVAVFVAGVAVDALALGFAPGDAPGRMSRRGGKGDDVPDVPGWTAERPFEHCHAAHGAADGDGDA